MDETAFYLRLHLLILHSAFGQSKLVKPVNQNITAKKISSDKTKIAILDIRTDCWLGEKLGSVKSFKLTSSDLEAVGELFKKCISQNNIDTSYFHYKKQYVPFIDKDGKKKVWINCFCSDLDSQFPDWKKTVVIVSDGGSCFFNLIINLSNNSFSDL